MGTVEIVCTGLITVAIGLLILRALLKPKPASLKDKVVIVTGASAGIGRAIAHAFAASGSHVVLVARRKKVLEEVEAELEPYGVNTLVVPTDISSDEQLQALVVEVMYKFERVDVLINNAGRGDSGLLADMDPAKLHQILDVNLHGTFRLTQLVLPLMRWQKSGHIVNMSSVAARVSMPGVSMYSATKAAIVAFSNCLRREVKQSGISVSMVLPNVVKTAMVGKVLDEFSDSDGDNSQAVAPFIRLMLEPEAVARVVVDVVRHRKTSVVVGGQLVATIAAMDAIAPGIFDRLLSFVNTRALTRLTTKMGK